MPKNQISFVEVRFAVETERYTRFWNEESNELIRGLLFRRIERQTRVWFVEESKKVDWGLV